MKSLYNLYDIRVCREIYPSFKILKVSIYEYFDLANLFYRLEEFKVSSRNTGNVIGSISNVFCGLW